MRSTFVSMASGESEWEPAPRCDLRKPVSESGLNDLSPLVDIDTKFAGEGRGLNLDWASSTGVGDPPTQDCAATLTGDGFFDTLSVHAKSP